MSSWLSVVPICLSIRHYVVNACLLHTRTFMTKETYTAESKRL